MNVIQAFETQKNALPDMVYVRTERTEDFSDYMREAIERAHNEEPETRSAASPERDRRDTHGHDDRRAHEAERDHEPHAARDSRHRDDPADDVADDDTRTTKTNDDQAPADETAKPAAEDKTGDTESEAATNDGESTTAAPADGKAATTEQTGEPAAKKTKTADAGAAIGQKDTGDKTGKKTDDAPPDGTAATAGAEIAAQAGPAVKAGAQATQQTSTNAATNKAAANPQAAAQAKAHAAANSAVQMSETAAAQQPVADDAVGETKPARGKDTAPGQATAATKKSDATTAMALKPDTGGDPSNNGKTNSQSTSGQSTNGQTATAAMAAQTVKPATPAFIGMLPNGSELPGQGIPGGDPAHATGLTQAGTTAEQTSAAMKMAAQKTAPSGHTPAGDQVAIRIASAVRQGVDRISIQLEPQDLGRVDVKLELSGDGRVTATVSADRQDTLDLLQRDSRALERALQQAGLKADSDSLNFNLRGGKGEDQQQAGGTDGPAGSDPDKAAADDDSWADPTQYRPISTNSALDIRV